MLPPTDSPESLSTTAAPDGFGGFGGGGGGWGGFGGGSSRSGLPHRAALQPVPGRFYRAGDQVVLSDPTGVLEQLAVAAVAAAAAVAAGAPAAVAGAAAVGPAGPSGRPPPAAGRRLLAAEVAAALPRVLDVHYKEFPEVGTHLGMARV